MSKFIASSTREIIPTSFGIFLDTNVNIKSRAGTIIVIILETRPVVLSLVFSFKLIRGSFLSIFTDSLGIQCFFL